MQRRQHQQSLSQKLASVRYPLVVMVVCAVKKNIQQLIVKVFEDQMKSCECYLLGNGYIMNGLKDGCR